MEAPGDRQRARILRVRLVIFVSVGTQLPFERLIRAADAWSAKHPDVEVFAQVGETRYQPRAMECVVKLSPERYARVFERASLVVSHVGMGTIIKGLESVKPLILMPRQASLGEHRSDHQLSTASKFASIGLIDIVNSEAQLAEAIARRLEGSRTDQTRVRERVGLRTSPELLARLRAFAADR